MPEAVAGVRPVYDPLSPELYAEAYGDAREDAIEETGLAETEFPAECPFTVEEVLSRDFLPER